MTRSGRVAWRVVQTAVWLLGVAILGALFFRPRLGIHAFWNVLIPVAPALFAFAPGVWRNICPMASTALFWRHTGRSARRHVTAAWQRRLLLLGALLLYLIVPLRHVIMDLNGPATGVTILALGVVATTMGLSFEWKSGWCSGLCPVHGVERLYGSSPAITPENAHCVTCHRCVTPCADGTPRLDPLATPGPAGLLLVGGFPGFIWGWFHVPDYAAAEGWHHLGTAYGWPVFGAAVTAGLFLIACGRGRRVFAAAAIACYYWYRLPALFGFGPYPGDGMLVDLTGSLPAWFPWASRILTTALFAWWLVGRAGVKKPWLVRPEFA